MTDSLMTDKTYVYDNVEVKLTGRKAKRETISRGRGSTNKVHEKGEHLLDKPPKSLREK